MKIKDYYDIDYAQELSKKISEIYPDFKTREFVKKVESQLDDQSYTKRMWLFVDCLENYLPDYLSTLIIFEKLLGPEIESPATMYSDGIPYAPIGKYIERHGPNKPDHFQDTMRMIEELTKRYTGEFAMRPMIEEFPQESMEQIHRWSQSDDLFVRRLASECMRVNLPWAKKLTAAVERFDEYKTILTQLNDDPDTYVQRSVGNNLNELYKYDVDKFNEVVEEWMSDNPSERTLKIIKHGSRTKRKQEKD